MLKWLRDFFAGPSETVKTDSEPLANKQPIVADVPVVNENAPEVQKEVKEKAKTKTNIRPRTSATSAVVKSKAIKAKGRPKKNGGGI